MALKLGIYPLRRYLTLICEYELHTLPNSEVSVAKDHGEDYIKVRPLLVRHLLRNRLLQYFACLKISVKRNTSGIHKTSP